MEPIWFIQDETYSNADYDERVRACGITRERYRRMRAQGWDPREITPPPPWTAEAPADGSVMGTRAKGQERGNPTGLF